MSGTGVCSDQWKRYCESENLIALYKIYCEQFMNEIVKEIIIS